MAAASVLCESEDALIRIMQKWRETHRTTVLHLEILSTHVLKLQYVGN